MLASCWIYMRWMVSSTINVWKQRCITKKVGPISLLCGKYFAMNLHEIFALSSLTIMSANNIITILNVIDCQVILSITREFVITIGSCSHNYLLIIKGVDLLITSVCTTWLRILSSTHNAMKSTIFFVALMR